MAAANCHCGMGCVLVPSWTDPNPRRRFFTCARGRDGCGYFRWFDPPMCARSVQVIPGLLRRLNKQEKEIEEQKARMKKMRLALVISWVIICWFLVPSIGGSN